MKAQNNKILGTCLAGGVEILGLHATVAPRRQQVQSAPVLEQYEFVPYEETNLAQSEPTLNEYSAILEKYVYQQLESLVNGGVSNGVKNCGLIADMISKQPLAKGHTKVTDEEMNRFSGRPTFCVIDVLKRMFEIRHDENFAQNIKNLILSERSNVLSDAAFGFIRNDRCLKTCLDVVIENCSMESGKLRVIECAAEESLVFTQAIPQLSTQPGLRLEYQAVCSDSSALDPELVEQTGVETAEWNISAGVPPPTRLAGADLVILGSVLHRQKNIHEVLLSIEGLVRDDGFLLVIEPTRNLLVPWCFFAMTQDLAYISDLKDRSFGPYCTEEKWRELLDLAGYHVVAQKSDGLQHTAYLCRKKSSTAISPSDQVTIDVDDPSFVWVEDVKKALAEQAASPDHNVWLRSREVNSGIVGLTNCLCREPAGERIRCAFNLEGETTDKEFAELVAKDLVQNVKKGGQWGSFRHLPLSAAREVETDFAYVNVLTRGDLSSLRWVESPLKHFDVEHHPEKDLCRVYYTSLNFRDIMLATGKLPPDAIPGESKHSSWSDLLFFVLHSINSLEI